MPGTLKSPELARRARERIPDLAVLFTSGYTENSIVHGGRLDVGAGRVTVAAGARDGGWGVEFRALQSVWCDG